MDPPVNQGQQHDQNPDLDHHWLPPSDSPPLQPGRDASTSQPLLVPIDSRHTGLMFSQDSARPANEQQQDVIPTPARKGNDTPHCTGLPDTDIAADDRPTEEADQKEKTGTTSTSLPTTPTTAPTNLTTAVRQTSNAVLGVFTTCAFVAGATLTWAQVTVTYQRAFTP